MKGRIKVYPHLEREKKIVENSLNPGIMKSELIGRMPFWCSDNHKHEGREDEYMNDGCCCTHTVGLPRHPATGELMQLTPYQIEFFDIINGAVKCPKGVSMNKWLRKAHKFILNKGRQMGFTEIVPAHNPILFV